MVERQEVEALLAAVDCDDPWWFTKTEMVVIAALCRAWLKLEDAPTGRVDMLCAADAIVVDEIERPEPLNKQRVRIVKEVG